MTRGVERGVQGLGRLALGGYQDSLSRDQAFPSISYPASVFPLVTNKHPLSLFYVTMWNLSQILMPP